VLIVGLKNSNHELMVHVLVVEYSYAYVQ
jgi:hypothetical protein